MKKILTITLTITLSLMTLTTVTLLITNNTFTQIELLKTNPKHNALLKANFAALAQNDKDNDAGDGTPIVIPCSLEFSFDENGVPWTNCLWCDTWMTGHHGPSEGYCTIYI